jgi:1-acyl-sn-glycerol-3-phosphate acyltransferase
MAGDIYVDRHGKGSITLYRQAAYYLRHRCSVMFFPEGTRSRSGRLNRFSRGAFELAIREQIPILPLVVDGTQNCLPKKSWKFGPRNHIKLKVLDPIPTEGFTTDEVNQLIDQVRAAILNQLSEWRGESVSEIDGMVKS